MNTNEIIMQTRETQMKKKDYIKPTCVVSNMVPAEMLAQSVEYFDEEQTYGSECQSNGRRGSWGNLWTR